MKKIKLPRKRKKLYIKDHGSVNYKLNIILGEMSREYGDRPLRYDPAKFIRKADTHPNGQLKKVISYY